MAYNSLGHGHGPDHDQDPDHEYTGAHPMQDLPAGGNVRSGVSKLTSCQTNVLSTVLTTITRSITFLQRTMTRTHEVIY